MKGTKGGESEHASLEGQRHRMRGREHASLGRAETQDDREGACFTGKG